MQFFFHVFLLHNFDINYKAFSSKYVFIQNLHSGHYFASRHFKLKFLTKLHHASWVDSWESWWRRLFQLLPRYLVVLKHHSMVIPKFFQFTLLQKLMLVLIRDWLLESLELRPIMNKRNKFSFYAVILLRFGLTTVTNVWIPAVYLKFCSTV